MNTTDDATDTTSRTTVETNNGNETHAHTTRIPHAQQRKPAMSYVLYFSKPFALAIAIWPFLSPYSPCPCSHCSTTATTGYASPPH